MKKIKNFLNNLKNNIKKYCSIGYKFILENKMYFIINTISILIFLILSFIIEWYFSLLIALALSEISILAVQKRGMFMKKKKEKNNINKNNINKNKS